jgi:hypothetical protein
MKTLRSICAVGIAVMMLASVPAVAGHVDNVGVPQSGVAATGSREITNFTNYDDWAAAMGSATIYENRYAELGGGVTVTDQYQAVYATYTDGDDVTYSYTESTDGMLLQGNGRINITFDMPMMGIGINFPGAMQVIGYMEGSVVFTSDPFGESGTFFFGGVVSTEPFDAVEILDWVDDTVYIDDVFYGADVVATESVTWSAVKALY